ncbi:YihY/virulence factor BrkB family protein [Haloimpatiens massiliensis]|uniref:YihY/virulence factor BrkB family protein n=1 Tax=Haloimpatiens massiliensis TaxID=1658110 RepID=UPI001FA8F26E|nr:YihY/virulence factor BrkB family protein [Haloimpatiens massiliensis]
MLQDITLLIKRIVDDDVLALGAQLAYGFILSFFPFLIFLLTIVGYSSISSEAILSSIQLILPQNAFDLVKSTVIEVVDYRKGNLLSFGLIGTIWASSTGFRAVIRGLNRAYDEEEKRPYWRVFGISVLCIFALILIIMSAFLLIVFGDVLGEYIYKWFKLTNNFFYFWNSLRYVVMVIFMIFTFACMYHFIPSKRMGWKEVMPGATFTALGWLISSLLFSYYVNNFNNYSRVYGSIGAVIVIILWLYITSVIILIGGELNAVLSYNKKSR